MSAVYVNEVDGLDWAVVHECTVDAARDVIVARRALGLGQGTYEIVRDGVVVARVLRGERMAREVQS